MQTAAASSLLTVAQPLPAHRGVSATPQISSSVLSTPKPVATPRPHPSSAVPRPTSAVPRSKPSSTAPSLNLQSQPLLAVSAPTNTNSDSLRGKKREREDGINGVPLPADSTYTNGVLNGNRSQKMSAKVGLAGARSRPIKKQRIVGSDSATSVHKP